MPAVLARVDLVATIKDEDGALTDPTTLTAVVTGPTGVQTSYEYAATITRTSAGVYTFEVPCDDPGLWKVVWDARTTTLRRSLAAQWEVKE